MDEKGITFRVGRPPLPTVLQELCDRLYSDDWTRYSTDDESSVYYIVGVKAWGEDRDRTKDHNVLSFPRLRNVSAIRERHVHAQVAAPKSSDYYLRQAIGRLERCGIDPALTRQFVKDIGDPSKWFLLAKIGAPGTESWAAWEDLLQALVMAKGLEPEEASTGSEKRRELELAVQKVYLKEVAGIYRGVVQRATPLEALEFSDPQLNEASRCYLYGFLRGTVLLSASAVEATLRGALSREAIDRVDQKLPGAFRRLVDESIAGKLLGEPEGMNQEPELAVYARALFESRNKVAHKGADPKQEEAAEMLDKGRLILEFVLQRRA